MSYHRHAVISEDVWRPNNLANGDRPMLAWWDAYMPVTIDTGVSNQPDRGVDELAIAQATASQQPAKSGIRDSSLITYDGTNDFLHRAVTTGDWQDLTYHEYWFAANVAIGPLIRSVGFEDDAGSADNRFFILITAAQDILMGNINAGTANNVETTSALTVGWHIGCCIADGSNYSMIIDDGSVLTVGSGLTLTAGSDNGLFVGGLTNKTSIDIMSVGSKRSTSVSYSPNLEKFGLSLGGTSGAAATTSAERTEIFNYINNRFQLGL